jgi:lysophospholipase L1-like esterase
MRGRTSPFFLLLALALAAGCGPFGPWYDYGAGDPRLQYTGRVDFAPAGATFSHAGTSIRFRFQGEGLDLFFRDLAAGGPQHTNYLNLFLDDRPPMTLELRHDREHYPVFRGLEPGVHTLEMVKRTESLVGTTRFLGISAAGPLHEPPPRPSRRMEFIGDSITCGHGNAVGSAAGAEAPAVHTSLHQDISLAYGSLTAKKLGAEVVHVCATGRGVSRNLSGDTWDTVPRLYERVFLSEGDVDWDFQRYVPDLIVLHVGAHDFAVEDPGTGLSTAPERDTFQQAYLGFVRRLRSLYPQALIVCALGPTMSDERPPGGMHWTLIRAWLAEVVDTLRAEGDARIHSYTFHPTGQPSGEDGHPTAETHARMAEELSAFLRALGG